ncbi:MAG: class I SAM-dependent methyltransferase [Bacillota bacterium]|nr:class I SAM-dependent methyltransferase [Bacillota bacterium]
MITTASKSCPICNAENIKMISEPVIDPKYSKYMRNKYRSCYCLECEYYFVSPCIDLSSDEWSQMYSDGYFNTTMTKWWAKKRQKERNRVLGIFKKYIGNEKIIKFLEIGCGEGYVLIDAQKLNWDITAIDVYDNRINEAKSLNIRFEYGDLITKNFGEEEFDLVYMDSVLEHVTDPVKYTEKIYKIMKYDGLAYFAVPNENALIFKFRDLVFKLLGNKNKTTSFQPFQHPYHINGYTKKSLLKLLEDKGFRIINYRNYAGWYEFLKYRFMSKGFLKNLMLLPIHLLAVILRMEYYQDVICVKEKRR